MPHFEPRLPRVLFDKLCRLYEGRPSGIDATGFAKLHPDQWEEFLQLLGENWDIYAFARDNFKFWYNRRKQRLNYSVLPGTLRWKLVTFFCDQISTQLKAIVARHPPSDVNYDSIRRIVGGISSFQGHPLDCYGCVILDAVWECGVLGHTRPCAVLEVTDSKGYKDTKSKVTFFIKDTRGLPGTGIVVNIDSNRSDNKRAFYALLKQVPSGQDSNGKNMYITMDDPRGEIEFRDKDGNLRDGELRISVRDFLGIHIARQFAEDCFVTQAIFKEEIVIRHSDLLQFLQNAEEQERAEEEQLFAEEQQILADEEQLRRKQEKEHGSGNAD